MLLIRGHCGGKAIKSGGRALRNTSLPLYKILEPIQKTHFKSNYNHVYTITFYETQKTTQKLKNTHKTLVIRVYMLYSAARRCQIAIRQREQVNARRRSTRNYQRLTKCPPLYTWLCEKALYIKKISHVFKI